MMLEFDIKCFQKEGYYYEWSKPAGFNQRVTGIISVC